jgi:hypothetical protein
MLFHSFAFFLFFLVTFSGYWALKDPRQRKGWLVVASCIFYGTWNPWLVFLILFTADLGLTWVIDPSGSAENPNPVILSGAGKHGRNRKPSEARRLWDCGANL